MPAVVSEVPWPLQRLGPCRVIALGGDMTDSMDQLLSRLVGVLADAKDLDATVEEIVTFASATVGADRAGITVIGAGGRRFETVGNTDELVWDLDKLQYDLREGPCVDAAVEGKTLWSTDLGHDARWPRWGKAAAERGVHSILSIELHARGQRIGALNLYGDSFAEFGAEEAGLAQMFAYHAAAALAVARNEESLRQALHTRTVIGQAQGILMERFNIEPEQAFNVLRRYSQDQNVRLSDLAQQLVGSRELPELVPSMRA